jgi:hypothetical protein
MNTALSATDALLLSTSLVVYSGRTLCHTFDVCVYHYRAVYVAYPLSLIAQVRRMIRAGVGG